MKKYLFLTILFILFFPVPAVFADNIQTGNSTVQNSVTNVVNGSNCSTHIEVTVNGQKEVVDSTDCGEHTLNKTVNGTITETSPEPSATKEESETPTASISTTPTSTPTPSIIVKHELRTPSLVSVVVKGIQDFFKRIFHVL